MTDQGPKPHGQCLCGAVQFGVLGGLRDILVCHCSQCQRWHGQAAYYTRVRRVNIELTGEENIRWYRSSAQARRGFCGECGSNLFWAPGDGDFWSIAAGSLYPGEYLQVAAHIFCDDAAGYQPGDPLKPCYGGSAAGELD